MLAITLYLTLKAFHVPAAIAWVGGAIATQAFAIRIVRTGDPTRLSAFAKDLEFVGQRLFTSASLVLLVLVVFNMVIKPGL
jgi:uncharacterized membrane protein